MVKDVLVLKDDNVGRRGEGTGQTTLVVVVVVGIAIVIVEIADVALIEKILLDVIAMMEDLIVMKLNEKMMIGEEAMQLLLLQLIVVVVVVDMIFVVEMQIGEEYTLHCHEIGVNSSQQVDEPEAMS